MEINEHAARHNEGDAVRHLGLDHHGLAAARSSR